MENVIKLAYEAGAVKGEHPVLNHTWFEFTPEQLDRFADLVAANEREQCAKVCGTLFHPDEEGWMEVAANECAAAIRARG